MNESGPQIPFGPWLPRRSQGVVHMIKPEDLKNWILFENDRLLVIDKPGNIVCHPSKAGPWSSLVGAAREYLGLPTVHLVFRLDRETSGGVVLAKDSATASRLQTAVQERRYGKIYLALLVGELPSEILINRPLGPDHESPVFVKSKVVSGGEGQSAVTLFTPIVKGGGFTLARVTTETGRKHQIRAHAQAIAYPLVGDKIYGPDPRLFLQFAEHGWSAELESKLLLPRHALHCAEIDLRPAGEPWVFRAPLPDDLRAFCETHLKIAVDRIESDLLRKHEEVTKGSREDLITTP